MTEYWKSQAKKYCEFCKVWITDDKATNDIHEKGLRHQQNVAKRIEEVKKKSVEDAKSQNKLASDLIDIERKAYIAFQRDVMQDISRITSSTSDSKAVEESLKEKIHLQEMAKRQEEERKKAGFPSSASCQVPVKEPVDEFWKEMKSPEGYVFYFNSKTKEKQWDKPECLRKPGDAASVSGINPLRPGEKRPVSDTIQDNSPPVQPDLGPGKIKLRAGVSSLLPKKTKTDK